MKTHDVPKSGTLTEMSYCLDCGAGYDDKGNCVPDGNREKRLLRHRKANQVKESYTPLNPNEVL